MTDPMTGPERNPGPLRARANAGARSNRPRTWAALNWTFRSRQSGRITIAQVPNVPLWIFLATLALRWVVPGGTWLHTTVDWIAVVALGWWALDEVIRGVNPWRRALGLGVSALVGTQVVSLLH